MQGTYFTVARGRRMEPRRRGVAAATGQDLWVEALNRLGRKAAARRTHTGMADREQAEVALAELSHVRLRTAGRVIPLKSS